MRNELLEAALGYASLGRKVFPLVPGQKNPATPNGLHDATTERATLEGWWGQPTDAEKQYGLGFPTGHGIVVIDVDVQHGGEIDYRWPPTLTAYTRSGGWHLYFYVDHEVRNSVGTIAKGVDVRGDGGYVVCPPTPGWKWANPGHEIAELSDDFLRPRDAVWGDWRPFELSDEPVGSGGRNDYLARVTGWLIHNNITDEGELETMVQRENLRIVDPPLDDREVRQIVRSVGRYKDRA